MDCYTYFQLPVIAQMGLSNYKVITLLEHTFNGMQVELYN